LEGSVGEQAAWEWATAQSDESTKWQKTARWVEDGRVWTSAGVSAGKKTPVDVKFTLLYKGD